MITLQRGNLFESEAEAIVNTVNTVGVMGKGIALQSKKAFPANYKDYRKACEAGKVQLGKMFIHEQLVNPKYIINFPTKKHWKSKSKLVDIESGLVALRSEIISRSIKSVAIPPLGCGYGGLQWSKVLPLIQKILADLHDVDISVYEPIGEPRPNAMPNRTKRPNMTIGRASVISLIDRYLVPGYEYRVSLLEIQKLAYFLQESGHDLRLQFVAHHYGPYADNLRHVLSHIEGHFIVGFGAGDNKPSTPIQLREGAKRLADSRLKQYPEVAAHMKRVEDLIEGYETPYGMELLATVHWLAKEQDRELPEEEVVEAVGKWSDRKRRMFKQSHISSALRHLKKKQWLT